MGAYCPSALDAVPRRRGRAQTKTYASRLASSLTTSKKAAQADVCGLRGRLHPSTINSQGCKQFNLPCLASPKRRLYAQAGRELRTTYKRTTHKRGGKAFSFSAPQNRAKKKSNQNQKSAACNLETAIAPHICRNKNNIPFN